MPIYDQKNYRSWNGQLGSGPPVWWTIGKTGIRLLWKKWMIILMLASYIPFTVRAVQIYLMTRVENQLGVVQAMQGLRINPDFFLAFFKGQFFFLLLVLILAGAGLIANDRKYKALPIYFSKPVSFWDYTGGKFLVLAVYGSLVTAVPALLLFLMKVMVSGDTDFLKQYWWIPLSIMGFGLVMILALGGLMLCLSALSKGSKSAAILFFALVTFPDVFRQIFSRISAVGLISIQADMRQVGAWLFGENLPFKFSAGAAALALAVVMVISYTALRFRVKPTEVVR